MRKSGSIGRKEILLANAQEDGIVSIDYDRGATKMGISI